jgi:dihydrofolate reductase
VTAALVLIAAVARNGVIGAAGGLPWKLPSDQQFFKRVTMGRPLIMGRKTYESLGRPLPGRTNIVATRRPGYEAPGAVVVGSFDAALVAARAAAAADGVGEIFVIGGGEIYQRAFEDADRLLITHVDAAPQGDTIFPEIDPAVWAGSDVDAVERSDRDTHPYVIRMYRRR